MVENPFLPVEPEPKLRVLTEEEVFYHKVAPNGRVGRYKLESGVPVKVEDLGSIKDFFTRAIQRAALLTPEEMGKLDFSQMTHIETAAVQAAVQASNGDLKALQEILDRVLGKSKMISETTTLSLTIDDVLKGVNPQPKVVVDGDDGDSERENRLPAD